VVLNPGDGFEGLIDELARVLYEPEDARLLALRAGLPPASLPAFRTSIAFWSTVVWGAEAGQLRGGVKALIDEVVAQYPGNAIFRRYQVAGGSQAGDSAQAVVSGASVAPVAGEPAPEPSGYDVFLSHNSADKPAVEAIAGRLQAAGLRPFFDAWCLIPGEPWIPALERALTRSAVIAVFVGPHGKGAWQEQESLHGLVLAAQQRGKRVIPVLLPGARTNDIDGFLGLRTWVDLAADDGFARLVAGITGRAPGPRMAPARPSGARQPVSAPLVDDEAVPPEAATKLTSIFREVERLLASGDRILAIKSLRTATGLGLAEAKAAIERFEADGKWSMEERRDAIIDPVLLPSHVVAQLGEVESLLARRERLLAIKALRTVTGLGLVEAKRVVEWFETHEQWPME